MVNYMQMMISVGQGDTEYGSRKAVRKCQKKKFPGSPWKGVLGSGLNAWTRTCNSFWSVVTHVSTKLISVPEKGLSS